MIVRLCLAESETESTLDGDNESRPCWDSMPYGLLKMSSTWICGHQEKAPLCLIPGEAVPLCLVKGLLRGTSSPGSKTKFRQNPPWNLEKALTWRHQLCFGEPWDFWTTEMLCRQKIVLRMVSQSQLRSDGKICCGIEQLQGVKTEVKAVKKKKAAVDLLKFLFCPSGADSYIGLAR